MNLASIYLRVSTEEQEERQQEPECLEYLKKNNYELFKIYSERESAFKDESKRKEFNKMILEAKENGVKHIIVWYMSRFSRQPPEEVFKLTKSLSLIHGIEIHAVHGDLWSDLVESISKIKSMGFMGEAISDFLETIIKGMEFQRSHNESKEKSDRVKLKVVKKEGQKTKSSYGKDWGAPKKEIPYKIQLEIKRRLLEKESYRKISEEIFKKYDFKISKDKIARSKDFLLSQNTPLENCVSFINKMEENHCRKIEQLKDNEK